MINFHLDGFVYATKHIRDDFEILIRQGRPGDYIPENMRSIYLGRVNNLVAICIQIGMEGVSNRFTRINNLFSAGEVTNGEFIIELKALLEAVEDDSRKQKFCYYPIGKMLEVLNFERTWAPALKKFDKIKFNAHSAVDCWALGHNDACVFHLMKVMELGVRRFSKRLGVNLVQPPKSSAGNVRELTWNDFITSIEAPIKALPQKTIKEKRKYEEYCQVKSYLHAVKDAWRNPTMHPREEGYTDASAQDLLIHVRSFMNGLAELLARR